MHISVPDAFAEVLRARSSHAERLLEEGTFPNNEALPVLRIRAPV